MLENKRTKYRMPGKTLISIIVERNTKKISNKSNWLKDGNGVKSKTLHPGRFKKINPEEITESLIIGLLNDSDIELSEAVHCGCTQYNNI